MTLNFNILRCKMIRETELFLESRLSRRELKLQPKPFSPPSDRRRPQRPDAVDGHPRIPPAAVATATGNPYPFPSEVFDQVRADTARPLHALLL